MSENIMALDNRTSLTEFERFMLRRIAKKVVIQGNHFGNIEFFYRVLTEEAAKEFNEDNIPTLNGLLEDIHKKSLL
jgi:hypothetical protein